MTDPCRDWRGSLGAAALGGIDPTEEIGLRAHLDGCALCRAELAELSAVARALYTVPSSALDATPVEPSRALAGLVLARLAGERDEVQSRRRRLTLVAAGSFLTAAAAVIVAVLVLVSGSGAAGTRVSLPGVGKERLEAHATATLRTDNAGTTVDVKVSGLDAGHYYWLWLTGVDGHRIAAGSFQGSERPISFRLTAAIPISEARRIWVTEGTNQVVLDARLPSNA